MDPAFLLPQQPAPVFGRTTNFEYKKVLPDPTWNANSPAGRHTFRWQNQAGEWWVPAQSYLRLRLAFLVCDGANKFRPVTPADGVAPVMNLPAHLFSRMEYYMDGHKLSDLQDHIPQIDTMKNRLSKSKAWFSSVGARSCFWDPNFATRQKQICPDFQTKALGVLQQGKLVSERAVVLNGEPVNLKGQILTAATSGSYRNLLGNLVSREVSGGQIASMHPWFVSSSEAVYLAAEKLTSPRWVRGRSGNYTYYCVSTGLNHQETQFLRTTIPHASRVAEAATAFTDGDDTDDMKTVAYRLNIGDQFCGSEVPAQERAKNISMYLDNLHLKKRMIWLHGYSTNVGASERQTEYKDSEMMATMPQATSEPSGDQKRASRYGTFISKVAYGNNIINESLADGIPVLLEQEFNDGQVRTEVVTWLPKLDIFVRRDKEIAEQNGDGYVRVGADANAHFTSWDACHTLNENELSDGAGRSSLAYPRLDITGANYTHDEDGTENGPTAPKNIKHVIIRPLTPSEDTLPSTRQEIIWKPPLGVFDVPHNIPTTTHELHMVIPNDYQTRCFDFGRQNLDATALGSGSGGRIMPFGLGANPGNENKGQIYLRIEGFEFYAGMAMGPRADEAKFVLDLREYRMTPYSIPEQQTKQTHTYPFNLSPTTASVCVAFQSSKAGNGSVSLSKFIVPTQVAPRGAETALQRFFVTFANQNRPREENESVLSYRGYSSESMGTQTATDSQAVQYFTQRSQSCC